MFPVFWPDFFIRIFPDFPGFFRISEYFQNFQILSSFQSFFYDVFAFRFFRIFSRLSEFVTFLFSKISNISSLFSFSQFFRFFQFLILLSIKFSFVSSQSLYVHKSILSRSLVFFTRTCWPIFIKKVFGQSQQLDFWRPKFLGFLKPLLLSAFQHEIKCCCKLSRSRTLD